MNSEVKVPWTPDPWRHEGRAIYSENWLIAKGAFIGSDSEASSIANARLIAAAPALADALSAMTEAFTKCATPEQLITHDKACYLLRRIRGEA